MHASSPFAEAFGEAVQRRGVSLRWLSHRLRELGNPVSVATLSYWRSGERLPERRTSMDALGTLEDLLHLQTGELTEKLGAPRRPGPKVPIQNLEEVMDALTEAVVRCLEEIECPWGTDLVEERVDVTIDVDADGEVERYGVLVVWTAIRDQAQRFPFVFTVTEPGRDQPQFASIVGSSIGRVAVNREAGVFAYEMLLHRPLRKGDLAITEYWLDTPKDTSGDYSLTHSVTRRTGEVALWARFHENCLPAGAERATKVGSEVISEPVIDAAGARELFLVERHFGPGSVSLRWWY